MESLTNVGGSQWRSGRKQGCNTGQMVAFVHYNRLHEAEDIKLYGAGASPLGRSAREVPLSKALVWKLMCQGLSTFPLDCLIF